MHENPEHPGAVPQHTHPLSFAVHAVQGLRSAVFPMVAAFFGMRGQSWAIFGALAVGVLILLFASLAAYIRWRKLTYTVGASDIRVESGIVSREARSVPYERIQDISLEQALIPRLFGLVQVKFETGAGGKDELALSYLAEAEGERLREVIRARKDGAAAEVEEGATEKVAVPPAKILFAMDPRRLFTFGLFEFSLAVFAVLAGLAQYADSFASIDLWNPELWAGWLAEPGGWMASLGPAAQIIGIIAGLLTLLVVGSATGLVRTFLRDWGFVLERTDKGFRRRRGLVTRTDVVMPAHRVQAVVMTTGLVRRRFGWYGLKFVSLAQDSGSASHDVAPFGKRAELAPIAQAAGFALDPAAGTAWQRGNRRYRTDRAIVAFAVLAVAAIATAAGLRISGAASPLLALVPLTIGILLACRQIVLWRFDFNALDRDYLFSRRGWLSPRLEAASRIKLQSVEIAQGPISKRRGYAALKLGLAGGTFEFEGLPLERAKQLRSAILTSIAGTDFSELGH